MLNPISCILYIWKRTYHLLKFLISPKMSFFSKQCLEKSSPFFILLSSQIRCHWCKCARDSALFCHYAAAAVYEARILSLQWIDWRSRNQVSKTFFLICSEICREDSDRRHDSLNGDLLGCANWLIVDIIIMYSMFVWSRVWAWSVGDTISYLWWNMQNDISRVNNWIEILCIVPNLNALKDNQ